MIAGLAQGFAPGPLADKPELYTDLLPYWNAFVYLSRARVQGEYIPITEIAAYCAMKGIDDPEFVEIVREFDLALMELSKERTRDRGNSQSID